MTLVVDDVEHCRGGLESLLRLADTFRDGIAALAERAGFKLAVVVLGTGDVVRLSAEHDLWWRKVIRDAIALIGERPEALTG